MKRDFLLQVFCVFALVIAGMSNPSEVKAQWNCILTGFPGYDELVLNQLHVCSGDVNKVLLGDGSQGFISSGMVTAALGFTPYDAANPSAYLTSEVDGSITNEIEVATQSGQSGKYLTTNGSVTNWTSLPTITLSGDITGSGTTTITATLENSGVTAGSYGIVTVDAKGRVTTGKRQETYSGTSDASGLYTVTFGTSFSAAPNIQANVIGGTTEQVSRIISVSTTGFQVHIFQRATVLSLALSTATTNVNGAAVDVLITQK